MSFDRLLEHEFPGDEGRADLESRVRRIRVASELAHALELLREQQQMPKARLAAALGRHPSMISRLLRSGHGNPTTSTVLEIIEAMGVYLRVEVMTQPESDLEQHAPIEITLPEPAQPRGRHLAAAQHALGGST
jgi:DNA-binding phage protein